MNLVLHDTTTSEFTRCANQHEAVPNLLAPNNELTSSEGGTIIQPNTSPECFTHQAPRPHLQLSQKQPVKPAPMAPDEKAPDEKASEERASEPKHVQFCYACRVKEVLRACPYRELRDVNVKTVNDCIELSGTVSSFYMKQLAQEIIRPAAPDFNIRNEIAVSESLKPLKPR